MNNHNKKNICSVLILLCIAFIANTAQATSFISFDPRSMAMGGSGVADGDPGNAALFNPALMIATNQTLENTNYFHLYAGARLIDRDDFIDRVKALESDNFEFNIDESLNRVKSQFANGVLSPADLRKLSAEASQLLSDVDSISNRPLRASASIGFAVGRTAEKFSTGLSVRKYLVMGSELNLSTIDVERMQQLIDTSEAMANLLESAQGVQALVDAIDLDTIDVLIEQSILEQAVAAELYDYADIPGVEALILAITNSQTNIEELIDLININSLEDALLAQNQGDNLETLGLGDVDIRNFLRYQIPEKFLSTIDYTGAEIDEISLSFAIKELFISKLNIGINLKKLSIDLIDFSQEFDNIEFGAYRLDINRKNYNRFNIDIGSVYQINDNYRVGLVIRNVIPYTLQTTSGKDINFDPIARIGMAYQSKSLNVALDYDLTTNEPLGFDPNKRYISSGAEFKLWKQNLIRAGYRYNTVDNTGLPSIGFGLGFQQGHVDIAVTRSGKYDEYGLSLQAGFQF